MHTAAHKEVGTGPGKRLDSKQSKLLQLAEGPLPSNWTVTAWRKPANKATGAPAERRPLYTAPTGETFKCGCNITLPPCKIMTVLSEPHSWRQVPGALLFGSVRSRHAIISSRIEHLLTLSIASL